MIPWSAEDLHRQLDVALGDDPVATRRTLHVESVAQHGTALELDVVVTDPAAHVDRQRWRLAQLGDEAARQVAALARADLRVPDATVWAGRALWER